MPEKGISQLLYQAKRRIEKSLQRFSPRKSTLANSSEGKDFLQPTESQDGQKGKIVDSDIPDVHTTKLEYSTPAEEITTERLQTLIALAASVEDPASVMGESIYYVLYNAARKIIGQEDFNPEIEDNIPLDPRISLLMQLAQKVFRHRPADFLQAYMDGLNTEIMRLIKERQIIHEFLKPGKFVAHALFSHDLPEIVKNGGLMSSVARMNNGSLDPRSIPRWQILNLNKHQVSDHDANYIFFYPWEIEEAGMYTTTSGEHRGGKKITDLIMLYPTESLAQPNIHMRVTGSDQVSKEIAVTGGTPVVTRAGRDTVGVREDDKLVLPVAETFFITDTTNFIQVRSNLKEGGMSPEWISSHVIPIDMKTNTESGFLVLQSIMQNKDEITQRVLKTHQVSKKQLKLRKLGPSSGGNNVFIDARLE